MTQSMSNMRAEQLVLGSAVALPQLPHPTKAGFRVILLGLC